MVKDTCLNSSLTAAQSLAIRDLEDYCKSQRLNNNDWKQAMQKINKTGHQTVPKYYTSSTKIFSSSLRICECKNYLNRSYG
jgi:hypothetical protein